MGSLNAARYTPPTGAGGPRTQVAAWGRSTRPATHRLPGPEARVPRWLRGVAQHGPLHAAYRGQRPAHPGSRVGSLNAARYTPPTEAGGPRTQVAAWGRSTRPATRHLPGPEARAPRWLRGVAQRGPLHAAYRGQRPAYPGGCVGSLNAARYTSPSGAGGPRTQVAAMEPVSDTNPICASRVSSCQRRSYPSIPPLAGGRGDADARTPGSTVFANRIGMRTLKSPPCTTYYLHIVLSNATIQ